MKLLECNRGKAGGPSNLPGLLAHTRQGVPYPLRSKGWVRIIADAERFALVSTLPAKGISLRAQARNFPFFLAKKLFSDPR
jgi:hypothetical protein